MLRLLYMCIIYEVHDLLLSTGPRFSGAFVITNVKFGVKMSGINIWFTLFGNNDSKDIKWTCMTFCTDIKGVQRMNLHDFDYTLTFYLL